jgi:hypothetical protein
VLTWSTYSIASSLAAAQGFRPWDMTLLRFAGGALLVLPFLPRRRIADLDGLGWRRGAGLALAGGPLFGLVVYSAFALAPLAHAQGSRTRSRAQCRWPDRLRLGLSRRRRGHARSPDRRVRDDRRPSV